MWAKLNPILQYFDFEKYLSNIYILNLPLISIFKSKSTIHLIFTFLPLSFYSAITYAFIFVEITILSKIFI